MKLAGIILPEFIGADVLEELGPLALVAWFVCDGAHRNNVAPVGTLTTTSAQDRFTKTWALRWVLELD